MKIYTGGSGGEKLEKLEKYNLGIMISSTNRLPGEVFKNYKCALDNGAFSAFKKGYPFNEYKFYKTLDRCIDLEIKLDFITTPDIVAGGIKSLEFSLMWADRLQPYKYLALVVQDGMHEKDLTPDILERFSHIFIGGSRAWKWDTASRWIDFTHNHGKLLHIGQCGTIGFLQRAAELGADSCDSTSFAVNQSWHILDEFYNPTQQKLFKA